MAIELFLRHPSAWLQNSSPDEVELRHFGCTDTVLKCPDHIGQGYSQHISVRDGLSILILDYELQDELIRRIEPFKSSLKLELEFLLAGPDMGRNRFILTSGRQVDSFTYRSPGNQHIFKLELHLQLPILRTFLDGLIEQLPTALKQLASEFFEQLYALRFPPVNSMMEEAYSLVGWSNTTLKMQQVLQQILNCPYQGLNRRLYLEAKSLELMALRSQQILEQLAGLKNHNIQSSSLQPYELDCIYRAKEILLNDLQNPPSLSQLAHQVGLNRRKLNECFQQVFHMTPFEYLQDYRLRQAQQILSRPDMKVEDVVRAVGYRSRSNFAVAFRKKFGLNPKLYQQQRGASL